MCIAAGRLAELGLEIELEVDRDWVDVHAGDRMGNVEGQLGYGVDEWMDSPC